MLLLLQQTLMYSVFDILIHRYCKKFEIKSAKSPPASFLWIKLRSTLNWFEYQTLQVSGNSQDALYILNRVDCRRLRKRVCQQTSTSKATSVLATSDDLTWCPEKSPRHQRRSCASGVGRSPSGSRTGRSCSWLGLQVWSPLTGWP